MHGWDVSVGSKNCFWVRFWKGWREEMLESERGSFYPCSRRCLQKLICRTTETRLQGKLLPSSPASLFNYLKSKTVSLAVWESPVSPAASWRSDILQASPVCPSFSLVQALCVRGFGCESEIPARAESPAHCFWSILTDRLGFPLSAKDFNVWLFPFLLLALLWLNPSHSLYHMLASRRLRPYFSNLCDGILCVAIVWSDSLIIISRGTNSSKMINHM